MWKMFAIMEQDQFNVNQLLYLAETNCTVFLEYESFNLSIGWNNPTACLSRRLPQTATERTLPYPLQRCRSKGGRQMCPVQKWERSWKTGEDEDTDNVNKNNNSAAIIIDITV